MARKQVGAAESVPEDATTKAYVDARAVHTYASEAEFLGETQTRIGKLTAATNWGAFSGITDLDNYEGEALVQTVYSGRGGGTARTQYVSIGDNQGEYEKRIRRQGTAVAWFDWDWDNKVPLPVGIWDAATKGYVDGSAITVINWTELDTIDRFNTSAGYVLDNGFDLGAATGIAKYDGLLAGQLWFVSNGGYSTGDVTAQVQQVWISNIDGTLDEIRRDRTDTGSWSAWAIEVPSGGGSVAWGDVTGTLSDQTDLQTALDTKATAGQYVGINAQTGTTYAPVVADVGKLVTLSNAGAITVTMPSNATQAVPVNSQIDFLVIGAGMATFAAGSGATVNGTPSLVTRAQYSAVTLIKIATNDWVAVGDFA